MSVLNRHVRESGKQRDEVQPFLLTNSQFLLQAIEHAANLDLSSYRLVEIPFTHHHRQRTPRDAQLVHLRSNLRHTEIGLPRILVVSTL